MDWISAAEQWFEANAAIIALCELGIIVVSGIVGLWRWIAVTGKHDAMMGEIRALRKAVEKIPGRPLDDQIRMAAEVGVRANWEAQEARWRQQMRNGQAAAELIMTAPTLADAVRVHQDFKLSDGRSRPEYAHFAILHRLTVEEDLATAGDAAYEIAMDTNDEMMLDIDSDEARALIDLHDGLLASPRP